MQALRSLLIAAGMFAAIGAQAEGENPAKPIEKKATLRAEIIDRLDHFDLAALDVKDALVEVDYVVDENGTIDVLDAKGDNCLMNALVRSHLENQKVYVSRDLRGQVHHARVRYLLL